MLTASQYRRRFSNAYDRLLEVRLRDMLNSIEPVSQQPWHQALRQTNVGLLEFCTQHEAELTEAHLQVYRQVKQTHYDAPESALNRRSINQLIDIVDRLVNEIQLRPTG